MSETSQELLDGKIGSMEKKILKLVRERQNVYCLFFFYFWFGLPYSNNPWVGEWITLDKWQSEFRIKLIVMLVQKQIMVQVIMVNGKWLMVT